MARTWGRIVPRSRNAVAAILVVASASTVSLLLRLTVPVNLLPNSQADDALFVRSATHLLHGEWLGPYDYLTLVKGPFYPVLLAVADTLALPSKLLEQLAALGAAALVAGCVALVARRWVAVAVYVVLALDPVNFSAASARVYRDGVYGSLTVALLASVFLTVWLVRSTRSVLVAIAMSVLSGLLFAAFWLCREEGVWIIPALAVLVVVPVLAPRCVRVVARHRTRTRTLLRVGAVTLVGVGAAALPIASVLLQNSRVYGVALVNDASSGQLARAVNAWTRVDAGPARALVPIGSAQRAAVYRVSPSARALEPVLEDPANHWRSPGCHREDIRICDDFAGGWIVWAIREAAAAAGVFSSAQAMQQYFSQVADDIELACSEGTLSCRAALPGPLQVLDGLDWTATTAAAARGVLWTLSTRELTAAPAELARVEQDQRSAFAAVVRDVAGDDAGAEQRWQSFEGWRWAYTALEVAYLALRPLLVVVSALGAVLATRSPKPRVRALVVLYASIAVAVGSRGLLLGVLGATTHPATESQHQLVTADLLLVLGCIGAALLTTRWGAPSRRPRRLPGDGGPGF